MGLEICSELDCLVDVQLNGNSNYKTMKDLAQH